MVVLCGFAGLSLRGGISCRLYFVHYRGFEDVVHVVCKWVSLVYLTGILHGLRRGGAYVETWGRHESVMFVPDEVNGEMMAWGWWAWGGGDMGSRDAGAWLVWLGNRCLGVVSLLVFYWYFVWLFIFILWSILVGIGLFSGWYEWVYGCEYSVVYMVFCRGVWMNRVGELADKRINYFV